MIAEAAVGMVYFCCDERRRSAVRLHATLNGIDYLEVVDREAASSSDRQRILRLHLFKGLPTGTVLEPDNIVITGGVRVVGVHAESPITLARDLTRNDVIVVHVNTPGDFSTYTLRLAHADGGLLPNFDPLLSAVDFSFKVECPSDFDCRQLSPCTDDPLEEPEIDYLSKDFNSFRQLMLDRLSIIIPDWKERNLADLGITLVELLAYMGDYLSYQQDAIATEAYMGTARRRISLRRHARLVDYAISDGCNARVWVQLRTGLGQIDVPEGLRLATRVPGVDTAIQETSPNLQRLFAGAPEFFETMHAITLRAAHNRMHFYTWGERDCCLPKGATRAVLTGKFDHLKPGDVLVFQEMKGPRTGEPEDADRTHRHAVRLTRNPVLTADPLLIDIGTGAAQEVTLIEWALDDALPFALCVSATTDEGDEIDKVSVALGNIVLADHGRTIAGEQLGAPLPADAVLAVAGSGTQCGGHERTPVHPRFRPRLRYGPLTMAATIAQTTIVEGRRRRLAFDPNAPAASAFRWDMNLVAPFIKLMDQDARRWFPARDLLASDAFAPEFVAEVEEDGRATLRFGDDEYGRRPTPNDRLAATYRIGNGTRGNIGADALAHAIINGTLMGAIDAISNPLPASGGVEPETLEHVRQNAPAAFFRQERAVTEADYAEVTERHPQVQRAQGTFRWTGSWRTAFVTIDRIGGRAVDAEFEEEMATHIERYRMAGHDLEINGPRMVSLEIALNVCVAQGYFRSDVQRAIMEAFSNRLFADGRRGFFHPDNFTFAQPVYLSRLYDVAQAVAGVSSVEFTAFKRQGSLDNSALASGVLEIGRLEIARLDNDRNRPENGVIRFTMGGGR